MSPFFRYCAAHAHVLGVHVTVYVARLQSTGWYLEVQMSVDTLTYDVILSAPETF